MINNRATTNGGVWVLISARQNIVQLNLLNHERLKYLGVGSMLGSQVQRVAYPYKFNGSADWEHDLLLERQTN